jgi:hypothetical protein
MVHKKPAHRLKNRDGVDRDLQWIYCGCAPGAMALKPSGFCNSVRCFNIGLLTLIRKGTRR